LANGFRELAFVHRRADHADPLAPVQEVHDLFGEIVDTEPENHPCHLLHMDDSSGKHTGRTNGDTGRRKPQAPCVATGNGREVIQ
jgi:hypothetical protein